MPSCSGSRRFYASIWRYCYDKDSQTAERFDPHKICEYLEKGVYTVEMFSKRNETLTREICKLQKAEADIQKKQTVKNGEKKAVEELIPTTQRILDSYPHLSVAEKNSLWKIVLEKITVFRTPEGEFSLHLYPKLPR